MSVAVLAAASFLRGLFRRFCQRHICHYQDKIEQRERESVCVCVCVNE